VDGTPPDNDIKLSNGAWARKPATGFTCALTLGHNVPKLAIGRATSREHGSSIVLGGARSIHAVKASALVCIRHGPYRGWSWGVEIERTRELNNINHYKFTGKRDAESNLDNRSRTVLLSPVVCSRARQSSGTDICGACGRGFR